MTIDLDKLEAQLREVYESKTVVQYREGHIDKTFLLNAANAVAKLRVAVEDVDDAWAVLNRERGLLIDRDIAGTINAEERRRLTILQAFADRHLQRFATLSAPTGETKDNNG